MKTILFQGDSITDAGRNLLSGCSVSIGQGYAAMLAGELGTTAVGDYKFENRGVSGNRIVDLYARMKADIWNLSPDYISILIGVNDVLHEYLHKSGVDAACFQRIYEMLIEDTLRVLPEAKFILMEPFVTSGSLTECNWLQIRDEVKNRGEIVYDLSKKYNTAFVPLQSVFDKACEMISPEYWISDGVHPTVAGHGLIKREWLKYCANYK